MASEPIDIRERLEQEREQGRREGRIEAKLDLTLSSLAEIQKTLSAQGQASARLEANYLQLAADLLEAKGRIRNLEDTRVEKSDIEGITEGLKAITAKVDGFIYRLALAGLLSGGAGASLYAAGRAAGLVP